MGMYTELVVNCELKSSISDGALKTLRYLMGELDTIPDNYPFDPNLSRYRGLLIRASAYFPHTPNSTQLYYDWNHYILTARCSLKNYNHEIEHFLKWLKPLISGGSGWRNMYAMVMHEEAVRPTIYYLNEE